MKNHNFILAFFLFITLVSGCKGYKTQSNLATVQLTEFMLGKWHTSIGHFDEQGQYNEEYFVKFGNNQKMLFCHKIPNNSFCDSYSYSQIKDNDFLVESKRALDGNWKISRQGENLEICFQAGNEECLEFTRDTSGYNLLLELFHFYW